VSNNLKDLVDISREYGSDPRWVVAGGGNTSLKIDDVLYVKASGFPLATIDEGGFARMDRSKLAAGRGTTGETCAGGHDGRPDARRR